MNIPSIIKNLAIHLSPSWVKKSGANSNQSKNILRHSSAEQLAGRDINVGGDLVNGDRHEYSSGRPLIDVAIGSSYNSTSYRIRLNLTNKGEAAAIIKTVSLAGEPFMEHSIILSSAGSQRLEKDIINFKVIQEAIENPALNIIYSDSSEKKTYCNTVYVKQQLTEYGVYDICSIRDMKLEEIK